MIGVFPSSYIPSYKNPPQQQITNKPILIKPAERLCHKHRITHVDRTQIVS